MLVMDSEGILLAVTANTLSPIRIKSLNAQNSPSIRALVFIMLCRCPRAPLEDVKREKKKSR